MSNMFSRMKESFNKGVATVSEKSSLMLETTKIKGQIAKLEDRNKALFQDLGRSVYDTHAAMPFAQDFIAEKCAEIVLVYEQIDQKFLELNALIGKDEVMEPQDGPEVELLKCECGTEIEPGARFCSNCGRPLQD